MGSPGRSMAMPSGGVEEEGKEPLEYKVKNAGRSAVVAEAEENGGKGGNGAVASSSSTNDSEGGKPKAEKVSLSKLFSYADRVDWAYIALGTFSAAVTGMAMPLFLLSFGNALDGFDSTDIRGQVNKFSLLFVIIGSCRSVFLFLPTNRTTPDLT